MPLLGAVRECMFPGREAAAEKGRFPLDDAKVPIRDDLARIETGLENLASPALDPFFWPAERLGAESAWWLHVPFAHWIVTATEPQTLVELGTYTGVSYAAFCQAIMRSRLATRCHAVDSWCGELDSCEHVKEALEEFRRFHDERYHSFSTLLHCTFDEALAYIEDESVDFLHIDGAHRYEAARRNFENWLPKLSGRGVVLFHGTNERGSGFEVWRLWSELRERYAGFEFLHGRGLGVLAVGQDVPPAVASLCILDSDAAAIVRERFYRLGERWLHETTERVLRRELERHNAASAATSADMTTQAKTVQAEAARAERAEAAAKEAAIRAEQAEIGITQANARAEQAETKAKAVEAQRARIAAAKTEAESRAALAARNAAEARARAEQAGHDAWRAREDLAWMTEDRDALLRSTSWKATWPLRWAGEQLPPGVRRGFRAMAKLGWWSLTLKLPRKLRERRRAIQDIAERSAEAFIPAQPQEAEKQKIPGSGESPAIPAATPTLNRLLRERFPLSQPLRVYSAPHHGPRITIVTDSISSGHLYGGVGTAIILGTLLAQRLGADLRLVTRVDPPTAVNIGSVLDTHGISCAQNIELLYSSLAPGGHDIPASPYDLFLTTSWWSTRAALDTVHPDRIVYLLQEDERMFYPAGDDQLCCTEILSNPLLLYVVNSKLLLDHLHSTGMAPGGVAFEPAFPHSTYYAESRSQSRGQREFFFYARPHNVRNLFWRGAEAIGSAIEQGVFDAETWNFYFVGRDIPELVLPRGIRPRIVQNLPWPEYAALVRRIDVGLSLMYTPHPSYPPLDLAASGAVVVTNRFGPKINLEQFSRNILCAEPTVSDLVKTLRRAVSIAEDLKTRAFNAASFGMPRDWNSALAPVLDHIVANRVKN